MAAIGSRTYGSYLNPFASAGEVQRNQAATAGAATGAGGTGSYVPYTPNANAPSSGGYLNANQSQRALDALANVNNRYTALADNGIYSPDQIATMAGAARQTVNNQTQAAAANAYKGSGGPDPFLSAAVASRGAAAAGQQYAQTKSALFKENADSRLQGLAGLAGTLGQDLSLQEKISMTPEELAAWKLQHAWDPQALMANGG